MEYRYQDQHIKYMKEQVWECRDNLSVYGELSEHEFKQFEKFLPESPKNIMDLGCGLGRIAIKLNNHYKDPDIHYILADRNGYTENLGQFNPDADEVYNDLTLTASFCQLNGIKSFRTHDTEGAWNKLPLCDLIISCCSFGFHVSIERYLARIISVMSPGATLIFGTRLGFYSEQTFANIFNYNHLTEEDRIEHLPVEQFLILRR